MYKKLFFTTIGALLLSGCMNNQNTPEIERFMYIENIAKNCADQLSMKVIDKKEFYTFSFAYYMVKKVVPVQRVEYVQTVKWPIPYFIAPSIDLQDEGSAWRQCMKNKNVLSRNILYPRAKNNSMYFLD